MQNNNEHSGSRSFRKFFQEKGYYIVLFLCILAVGISGYIFVSSAVSEKNSLNEETLSVATNATVPSASAQQKSSSAAQSGSGSGASGSADKPAEPSAPASAMQTGDDAVRAAAASIRVWPVTGQTLSGYSMEKLAYNKTMQDWRTHDGVDILAAQGATVQAACAGTVTAVYDDEYLGTTLVIAHDGGYTTQYSNLAAMPTVSVGDTVAAGDVIGAVGATALLEAGEEPHLHFSVCQNGTPIDPADFID